MWESKKSGQPNLNSNLKVALEHFCFYAALSQMKLNPTVVSSECKCKLNRKPKALTPSRTSYGGVATVST